MLQTLCFAHRGSAEGAPHLLRRCHTNFAVMTTLYFALVPQRF